MDGDVGTGRRFALDGFKGKPTENSCHVGPPSILEKHNNRMFLKIGIAGYCLIAPFKFVVFRHFLSVSEAWQLVFWQKIPFGCWSP